MKIIQYGSVCLLSFFTVSSFAQEVANDPLVFQSKAIIASEISAGDIVGIQYTIKNQTTTASLPITSFALNQAGVPDNSTIRRKVTNIGDDCGPQGSFLLPQDTCTLTYEITAPNTVDATVHQTVVVDYDSRYDLTTDVSFKVIRAPQWAYVVSADPVTSVKQCDINSSTGSLSSCADTGGGALYGPVDIAFASPGAVPYAYITKAAFINGDPGRLNRCEVNIMTGALGPCTQASNVTGQPFMGVAFYTAQNGLYAYISIPTTNTVLKCKVDEQTGAVPAADCSPLSITVESPQYITIQSFADKTYAYVGTHPSAASQNLRKCVVDPVNGNWGACESAVSNPSPIKTQKVSFASVNGVYHAYITRDNSVRECTVNVANGRLFNCSVSGGAFVGPQSMAKIALDGTQYVYVTHRDNQRVKKCTVDETDQGDLDCIDSGAGSIFNNPRGIALF